MIFADHKIQPKSKNPPKLYQIHPLKNTKKNSVPFPIFLPKQNLWFFRSFPQLPRTNTAFPRFPNPFLAGRWVGPQTTPVMLQSIDASAQGNDIGHDLFFSAGRRCGICRETFFLVGGFINGWLSIWMNQIFTYEMVVQWYLPSVFNPVEKY